MSRIGLTLLCGLSALAIQACSTTKFTAQEQELLDSVNLKSISPAAREEREAIATQPPLVQATFWAEEHALNPADLEASINLVSALRKIGSFDRSLQVANQSLALYPDNPALLAEYSASLISAGQARQAITPLEQALRLQPQNARLWRLMGTAYDQVNEFPKARQYYERALTLAPNDTKVLGNIGMSFALEGDPVTAEAWLRQAANHPDADAQTRQNLALVLGLQGKFEEAERWSLRDLSKEQTAANMDYIRTLISRPQRWQADPSGQPTAAPTRVSRPARPGATQVPPTQTRTFTAPPVQTQQPAQSQQPYSYTPGATYQQVPPAATTQPQSQASGDGSPTSASDMARMMAQRSAERGTVRQKVPAGQAGGLSTPRGETTVYIPGQ